ncbi:hypothetical protein D0T84_00915 [Dysgonomonas sp. 521]|uniref:hypothetical protein n=1 Tax=Dysgonomonas sp. 521 TaxID=2302932 RepID=UPI0013CFCD39|nr:hypothetical protein [Dysgonomonas sp. 521]NDV93479.1 hypothetical protein [Dysgonomonas sp. 521]
MATIEIKGSRYQKRIDAFTEALKLLNAAKEIILANVPDYKEGCELVGYRNSVTDAESDCTSTICDISSAISELVREDVSETYL